jgi:addiction module HigA family antidote
MIKPPHPGETIREDYLVPLGMSVNRLSEALGIGATRLNEIVRGKRGITADTALRLARYFGTSAEFWLNLQSLYDLRQAERQGASQDRTRGDAAQGCLSFMLSVRGRSVPIHATIAVRSRASVSRIGTRSSK